jgi:glycosyltransferase involved in cell wall biosynthesis
MNRQNELPRIMVSCASRIPSVELGAIIPLAELQTRKLCVFAYKNEDCLTIQDIAWCDILFLVRAASYRSVWAARKAKDLGRLVLGYWDDGLDVVPNRSQHYTHYSSPEIQSNILTLFGLTDNFFSPSPKLAARLSEKSGRQALVLPVPLGVEKLRPPGRTTRLNSTVGYATSPDHTRDMNFLLIPAVKQVAESGINFRFHVIGPEPKFTSGTNLETIFTPYIKDYRKYENLASNLEWEIGLAPQFNDEFAAYKFHNKLLEYTHIGCAGIYSNIDIYSEVIQDGITGILVNNRIEDWKEAILRLLKDPELRFRIAANAYEYIQSRHNRNLVAEGYFAALAPFLAKRAPSVRKSYVVTLGLASGITLKWRQSKDYMKVRGLKRFIVTTVRYGLSSIRGKKS